MEEKEPKKFVRRRGGFADRNNIAPISKEMQLIDFLPDTRIVLKNLTKQLIEIYVNETGHFGRKEQFVNILSTQLFCISLEGNEAFFSNIMDRIYTVFDKGTYDEILDTIEFLATNLRVRNYDAEDRYNHTYFDLFGFYNHYFEDEYIGYRFVNKQIVAITNKTEIECIEKAAQTKYAPVNIHIKKAIQFISENGSKDFKNSIKESISSVETLCSIITKNEKSSLGNLIDNLSKIKPIHPALKESIKKLYGFASDEEGIRHGKSEEKGNVSFNEAELVLIICSGIVNYFIASYCN